MQARQQREHAIKRCISQASGVVQELRKKKEADPDNIEVLKHLRKEQSRVGQCIKNKIQIFNCNLDI